MNEILIIWLVSAIAWDVAYLIRNAKPSDPPVDRYTLLDLFFGALFAPLLWVLWAVLFAIPGASDWLAEKLS